MDREPTKEEYNELSLSLKIMRKNIQKMVDDLGSQKTRERSLAITKLQEAKMWLGQELGNIPGNVDLNKVRDEKELR